VIPRADIIEWRSAGHPWQSDAMVEQDLIISRALAEGGIAAAHARYAEIKGRDEEFYFGECDLLDLALELFTAGKSDLAIEVQNLSTHLLR